VSAFWRGVAVVLSIELRQRVRGVAWYVLLGVFFLVVGLVTLLLWVSLSYADAGAGPGIFSTVIFFVLLLGTLVTPALSGGAINGDRDEGTLATTQITLITTPQLVIGKFMAAWITALAFLVAALPYLTAAVVAGGVAPTTIVVAVPVLALELGVVAAVGVGLSGLIRRPLFSVAVGYLVVAVLGVGTLIAFALGGLVIQSEVRSTYTPFDASVQFDATGTPIDPTCSNPQVDTSSTPRFDLVWWMLAANPYVVVADAVPGEFDARGNAVDLFGALQVGVRSAQQAPDLTPDYSDCDTALVDYPTQKEIVDSTVPSWFVGLALHLVLGAAALVGAGYAIRAPARQLAAGSRIA
jgi:ABC-type transport system involved in multi-copper enzyme maturation permease subunit